MAEYYSTSTHYDPVRASTHSHTHSLSHSLQQATSHTPLPAQQFSSYNVPPHPLQQQIPTTIHSTPLYPMTEPLASAAQNTAASTTTTTAHSPTTTTTTTPMKPKATRRRKSAVAPKAAEPVEDDNSSPNSNNASPAGAKDNNNNNPNPTASGNAPRSVNIRTKFPVARIKRIMQADEDVGKVAQVTPVVVSKALELFMIALCDKASEEARSRNSKRITAGHLKQAILNEVQFDFLADIIEKVPDIPAAAEGGNLAGNDGSEDGAPVKKTRKPRTRKPKDEDSF